MNQACCTAPVKLRKYPDSGEKRRKHERLTLHSYGVTGANALIIYTNTKAGKNCQPSSPIIRKTRINRLPKSLYLPFYHGWHLVWRLIHVNIRRNTRKSHRYRSPLKHAARWRRQQCDSVAGRRGPRGGRAARLHPEAS